MSKTLYMGSKDPLTYEALSDGARFREQYRFIFSAAIIATFFVIPDENILWQSLSKVIGFSALFAALYLIMSAARVKYREPGRMYEVFKVSESLRMRAFDWSVHVFAIALLFFVGILITGSLFNLFGVVIEGPLFWSILIVLTLCVGIILLVAENYLSRRDRKSKSLPQI